MKRKAYDSALTDIEWLLLAPRIPPEKRGGRESGLTFPPPGPVVEGGR